MKYLKNLKGIDLSGKYEYKIGNVLRDDGCTALFNNVKYLTNLKKLNIHSNRE